MQNIMKGKQLQSMMPSSLMEVLEIKKLLTISDYLVIVYVTMFALWMLHFIRNVFRIMKNYYYHETGLMAMHKATYANDTILALKLCKKYPQAINKTIDEEKFTPFLRACYHGNTQLVRYMLQRGADVEARTARLENGLYLAVYNRIKNRDCKDASCIHALYHSGVDINAANANGLNVLQLASMFGHGSLVRWLLSKKANFDVEPNPYVLAKSAGHTETANLLRELHVLAEK